MEIKSRAEAFAPGDTILLSRGNIWNETFVIQSSGTEDNPLTIGSHGEGALPIINGQQKSSTVMVSDSAYITLQDLEIIGGVAGVHVRDTEHLILDNLVVHDNSPPFWCLGAIVVNNYSTDIQIINCSVYNNYNGGAGIFLSSANTIVKSCRVYNNENGIHCVTDCNVNAGFHITENYVHDNEKFGILVTHVN